MESIATTGDITCNGKLGKSAELTTVATDSTLTYAPTTQTTTDYGKLSAAGDVEIQNAVISALTLGADSNLVLHETASILGALTMENGSTAKILGYVQNVTGTIDDDAITLGCAGTGTETDPYQISSILDLTYLRYGVDGYYQLQNDINAATSTPRPVGVENKTVSNLPIEGSYEMYYWFPNSTSDFSGTLDGDDHTIENLYVWAYLFNSMEDATIKDLTIKNVKCENSQNNHSLFTLNANLTTKDIHLTNLTVSNYMEGGTGQTGGLLWCKTDTSGTYGGTLYLDEVTVQDAVIAAHYGTSILAKGSSGMKAVVTETAVANVTLPDASRNPEEGVSYDGLVRGENLSVQYDDTTLESAAENFLPEDATEEEKDAFVETAQILRADEETLAELVTGDDAKKVQEIYSAYDTSRLKIAIEDALETDADVVLHDVTIPKNMEIVVPEGKTLYVDKDATVTLEGTLNATANGAEVKVLGTLAPSGDGKVDGMQTGNAPSYGAAAISELKALIVSVDETTDATEIANSAATILESAKASDADGETRLELAELVNELEALLDGKLTDLTIADAKLTYDGAVATKDKLPEAQVANMKPQGLMFAVADDVKASNSVSIFLKMNQILAKDGADFAVEVTPYKTVGSSKSEITNDEIKAPVTFNIYLPETFTGDSVEIEHYTAVGGDYIETIQAAIQQDTDGKRYARITVTEFSVFYATAIYADDDRRAPTVSLEIELSGAGDISPNGGSDATISVTEGSSKTFTIQSGEVDKVLYNGEEIDVVDGKFTIKNIKKGAELEVIFSGEAEEETATSPYADLDVDDYGFDAICNVSALGIMNGYPDDTFRADTTLSRAMVAEMLYRMAGSPAVGVSTFADVPADQWYSSGIAWAAANGLVEGYTDGTFKPDQAVTRQELAVILYRVAQANNLGYTGNWMFLLDVADRATIADWAYEAVCWCNQNGLLPAQENNTLSPTAPASRADVAVAFDALVTILADLAQ